MRGTWWAECEDPDEETLWAVRELTAAGVLGGAPMAAARQYFQIIRRKRPTLNVKLAKSTSVSSDKLYFVTEHASLADLEQWNNALWADDDVKHLVERLNRLA